MAAAKSLMALMGGGADEESDAVDPMADKMAGARDFMAAMKRGDAEGVAHAFQAMYDACAALGGEGYEGDDEEDFDELEGA